MSEPIIDPERVAALFDGKLNEQEREQLLAELARSEESRLALGDLSELMRDLELSGAVPDRVRKREKHWRPVSLWTWGAAAASAVLAVGITLRHATTSRVTIDRPSEVLALLGPSAASAGDAADATLWSATRGAGASTSARGTAVRFGVRAVELEAAALAGDSVAVARRASQVTALLNDVLRGGPAVAAYRSLILGGGVTRDSLVRQLDRAWTTATNVVSADGARVGAWLSGARIATVKHEGQYFRRGPTRQMLDLATSLLDRDAATARQAAVHLGGNTAQDVDPPWELIENDIATLTASLAN